MRPSLAGATQPDLQASAYAFGILHAAEEPATTPWTRASAVSVLREAKGQHSVWADWYAAVIDTATGSPSSGGTTTLTASLSSEGYFDDLPSAPIDAAARLASTAAALETYQLRGLTLGQRDRAVVTRWVTSAMTRAANPYQIGIASQSLRLLGGTQELPPAASAVLTRWSATHQRADQIISPDDCLDAYGYVAAAAQREQARIARLAVLRRNIAADLPDLDAGECGYSLARAWLLLGGSRTALLPLAESARSILASSSGLVERPILAIGTVSNSLAVERIRRDAGRPTRDDRLAAVASSLASHPSGSDPTGLNDLELALTARLAGAPSAGIEAASMERIRSGAPATVALESVGSWSQLSQDLSDLTNGEAWEATLVPWPTADKRGRYAAWLALSLPPWRFPSLAARRTFAAVLGAIPTVLRTEASTLSMKEIEAGVTALAQQGHGAQVPWGVVRAELLGLNGCGDVQTLYRPSPASASCDLASTALAYRLLKAAPR